MKQLTMHLKNRKGMSLMELLVAMMTFAIISIAVASILMPILSVYSRANSLAESNTILDSISTEILNDIAKARSITITDDNLTIHTQTFTVSYGVDENGYLYRDTASTLLFPADYYKNKTISLSFFEDLTGTTMLSGQYDEDSNLSLVLNVGLYEDGVALIDRSYAARPLGLNQYKALN